MPGKFYPRELKEEILNKIKSEGITAGELIEYIYQQVYYYNNKRIHSILKMTPSEKRKRMTVTSYN